MAREWREVLNRRRRTSKTRRLYEDDQPTNKYSWDGIVGASVHYEPVEGSGEWLEVDPRIVPSSEPGWDWEMQKSHWRFLARNGGWFAAEKRGVGIGFRLERVAYLNIQTKEWQTVRTANYTTPTVEAVPLDNDLLPNPKGLLTWHNLFPDTDFEIHVSGDRLHEEIKVSQAARDAMPALPYPAAQTYLVMVYEVDWGQVPGLADDDGDIDKDSDFERQARLYLKNHQGEIITALPASKAWPEGRPVDEDGEPIEVPLRKRFVKVGGKHYLLVGAPVLALNALPEGTIIFDPDIDEQVGADADDCRYYSETEDWSKTSTWWPAGCRVEGYETESAARFTLVAIAQGATIDVATLKVRCNNGRFGTTVNTKFQCEDADDTVSFDDYADYDARLRTATSAAWNDLPAWIPNVDYTCEDVVAPIQTVISRLGWSSGNNLVIFWTDNGSTPETYRTAYSYEGSSTYPPKLHIEFTVGNGAITGTAAVAAEPAEVAAEGTYTPLAITGTSAVSTQLAQAAATGEQTFAGTSAVTSQPAESATEAELVFAATSAVTAQPAAVAAEGTYTPLAITGTSTVTGEPAEVSATGTLVFTGTSAVASQVAQVAAEGTTGIPAITGTSALTAQLAQVAATGAQVFTGTSAITSQPAETAATGALVFAGTSAVASQPATTAIEGTYTPLAITGTSAVTSQLAEVAAEGTMTVMAITGTLAVEAEPAVVSIIACWLLICVERSLAVLAESRSQTISAESRLVTIVAENRTETA